ncbi:hypothetical protein, partial [Enterococcus faecium]
QKKEQEWVSLLCGGRGGEAYQTFCQPTKEAPTLPPKQFFRPKTKPPPPQKKKTPPFSNHPFSLVSPPSFF